MARRDNEYRKEKKFVRNEKIIQKIRSKSEERPQRVVIDEILSDDLYRVLIADKSTKEETKDKVSSLWWSDEEEHLMNWNDLSNLISKKKRSEVNEGQVFRLDKNEANDILDEVKTQVSNKTKKLLAHEGRSKKEMKKRR